SPVDPLMGLEYHRHFTHSLFFIPFGALLVAAFIWLLFYRKEYRFLNIYFYTAIAFATHGILDACTSYGTRLYWPFFDIRESWNIISIIDPIFTITLLICFILFVAKKSNFYIRVGMIFALFYLSLGFWQHQNVKSTIYQLAADRGHNIERVLLNPTIGNIILWRSVYLYDDNYYVDAVRMPLFGKKTLIKGVELPYINQDTVFPGIAGDSVARHDIKRFSYFSQDYIYMHPDHKNIIGDLRYGILPQDIRSLWGIKVNPANDNEHVDFIHLRNFTKADRKKLWNMIIGRDESVTIQKNITTQNISSDISADSGYEHNQDDISNESRDSTSKVIDKSNDTQDASNIKDHVDIEEKIDALDQESDNSHNNSHNGDMEEGGVVDSDAVITPVIEAKDNNVKKKLDIDKDSSDIENITDITNSTKDTKSVEEKDEPLVPEDVGDNGAIIEQKDNNDTNDTSNIVGNNDYIDEDSSQEKLVDTDIVSDPADPGNDNKQNNQDRSLDQ
ncbi:MAG: metal-dependent hydrolase, partial [Pseudomonadota bacterium]